MLWLAWKVLLHERVRLLITVTGIAFATVLVLAQVGIYLGMMSNATAVITHTDADLWVAPKNIRNFDFANPVPAERLNRVRSRPEVLWAERLIVTWSWLKLANGGREQVQVIGFNPDKRVGAPWAMVVGTPADVKGGRFLIMDTSSEKRVGKLALGTLWELGGRRFRLVGLSRGIRSFTTAPMIFTAYDQLRHLGNGLIQPDETTYIVAKLKDSRKSKEVAEALAAEMRDNDVLTRDDFFYRTVKYWTVQTGIGMSFFLTAFLGLLIGGAIVGQTIYANTMEHLKEYGTLKAMGAGNEDIYQVIFAQAGISSLAGFVSGALIVLSTQGAIEKAGVPILINPLLLLSVLIMIALTGISSAYFSVKKIRTLDPAMVFRG